MLKGNINFNVNVDIHIGANWSKDRIQEFNENAISDRLLDSITQEMQYLLAPEEDATVTIDKYIYTNLHEVKE